jgi:hypothetical protein
MFRRWNYLQVYVIGSIAGTLAVMGGNWLVDPLHFFHRPILHHTFVDNQRYQNPGLAKNYVYDAVVIGTSHTENFSSKQIQTVLGWKSIPLSISGSTAREQNLVLNKALATGQLKNVLWGIDYTSFHCEPTDFRRGADFPMYLYEETPMTAVKYLLSRDTLDFSRRALAGRGPTDLETLHTWPHKYEFSEKRVLEAWKHERMFPERKAARYRTDGRRSIYDAMAENVETNLIQVVKGNPDVTFHLFFPPYSILTYINDFAIDEEQFEGRLIFKEEVVRGLADCDNCRIHDFETAFEISHDLDNYKDLWHYGRHINDVIVEAISRDEYRIDAVNCRAKLDEFEQSVRTFADEAMQPTNPWHARLELDQSPLHLRDRGVIRVGAEEVSPR